MKYYQFISYQHIKNAQLYITIVTRKQNQPGDGKVNAVCSGTEDMTVSAQMDNSCNSVWENSFATLE